MEASFGKTKLVKLLYLIDVEFFRSFSRQLTNIEWIFYHYGPYAFSLEQTFSELDLDIPQEDVFTASGAKAKIFRLEKHITSDLENSTGADKIIIDRVIKSWGYSDLNPLLSYVYFHTEPMITAERGESLDFSKIKKLPAGKPEVIRLPLEFTQEIKERFLRYKASRAKSMVRELDPKPRFDGTFLEGLNHMDMEELAQLPNGEITIDEESKDTFRRLS
jgi:hypothetical protein